MIVFSAQFDLRNKWALESNSFLRKYADEDEKSKWYNLRPLLESSKVPIYYIVPIRTEQDRHQTRQIKSIESVKPIMFYSKRHGTVVLKDNLNVLISLSTDEWERIYEQYRGKKVLPFIFSLRIDCFWGTIVDIVKHIQRVIKRKLSNLRK